MSGDQEPWVFRGGLTADLQVSSLHLSPNLPVTSPLPALNPGGFRQRPLRLQGPRRPHVQGVHHTPLPARGRAPGLLRLQQDLQRRPRGLPPLPAAVQAPPRGQDRRAVRHAPPRVLLRRGRWRRHRRLRVRVPRLQKVQGEAGTRLDTGDVREISSDREEPARLEQVCAGLGRPRGR